jgi:dTMP kinase
VSKGKFIVFEGGEGTGKTTQIRLLKDWLDREGRPVLVTWEPGGSELGKRLREMILDPALPPMDARCEALLFAAARAEHVAKVIRPAIEAGTIVLCDRYWDASKAYQGAGRGLGFAAIEMLNEWGTQHFFPDRSYLFDFDPKNGLDRAQARGQLDRMEQESLDFHRKVREAYRSLAARDLTRYRTLDASRSIEELFAQLQADLKSLLA